MLSCIFKSFLLYFGKSTDPVIKREAETHERALLYVAATRAKKNVIVTSFGNKSRFLVVFEEPGAKLRH